MDIQVILSLSAIFISAGSIIYSWKNRNQLDESIISSNDKYRRLVEKLKTIQNYDESINELKESVESINDKHRKLIEKLKTIQTYDESIMDVINKKVEKLNERVGII